MQIINLRCVSCGRKWAVIYNGVFSAVVWNPSARESSSHAISVRDLVALLAKHEGQREPIYLADQRREKSVQWATIENDTLCIVSRHGGSAHTNFISLNGLIALLRGTKAHDDLLSIQRVILSAQDEAGTKLLAEPNPV